MGEIELRTDAQHATAKPPLLTVEDVAHRLAEIAQHEHDDEVAHGLEDSLRSDVLAAIAAGAPDAQILAAAALRSDGSTSPAGAPDPPPRSAEGPWPALTTHRHTPSMPADSTPLWDPHPEGRPRVQCLLCDEPLTAAESRRWALGPRCRRKLGLTSGPGVGRFDVPQDVIPGA